MSFILANSGVTGSYVFVAILAVGGLMTVAFLGTETRGQTIEQVSELQERRVTHFHAFSIGRGNHWQRSRNA